MIELSLLPINKAEICDSCKDTYCEANPLYDFETVVRPSIYDVNTHFRSWPNTVMGTFCSDCLGELADRINMIPNVERRRREAESK